MENITTIDPAESIAALPVDTEHGDYWHSLINEKEAGEFLDVVDRTMQQFRQRGDGPKFVRLSSRCIRYRRIDLKIYSDGLLRTSTADQGGDDV